ncbi:hypothetical protein BDK51DRAFT_33407, partial [Blyttiomyces helicus]
MVDDLDLTTMQASYAVAAAFYAALNQTWMRHTDWMTCLSGFDGLRVLSPWAVGALVVPALSEARAVWAHAWKVHDVACLVTTIGFGCAGAAILLYLAVQSHATTREPADYSISVALEEGTAIPPSSGKPTLTSVLSAGASITLLTWWFHGIVVTRAETQEIINPLLSISTPPSPPPALLVEPLKPDVVPLCMIATWSGPNFSALSEAFIKSVAPSGDQLRLNLFVDGAVPPGLPNSTVAPYLHVVTLESINSSYATRQWAGFICDRICAYFGSPIGSRACQETEAALRNAAVREPGHPPIMQFRGMYGRLFEEWIGPTHCGSWGWLDTDMLLGDVAGWLASSPEYRDADIATFSNLYMYGGPLSLYTRGQLTIHNQRRIPHIVNELWRGCKIFKSLGSIASEFSHDLAEAVDEGCYSKAVFRSRKIVVAVLPWQAADWEGWEYGAIIGGRLFVARG